MSEPTPALVADLARIDGDIMVLGVGGKMGPTLARMAKRAAPGRRVIGVARFSDPAARATLERHGVECIACDLLDRDALQRLPKRRRRRAQPRLHGRPQVRRLGQPGADLDDERRRAGDGGRGLSRHAHRHLLHRLRVPLRAGGRPGRGRGHAGDAAAGRLRVDLRRPRAHVRARLAALGHAGAAGAPVLCHRHALRRALRRRQQRLRRPAGGRDDGPCRRHLAGRCQRAGAAPAGALHGAGDADQRHRARGTPACAGWRPNSASASAARRC